MDCLNLEKKFVKTGNGRIYYFIGKKTTNRPILIFLHGLSSNHTTWLNIMKKLLENGYNFLTLDLRGHGFSDKTKKRRLYQLSVFSDDLEKILKQEQIRNFILIGYSFGGQIAIDYVIKYPQSVKGLILISTNHVNPLEYKHLKFLTA